MACRRFANRAARRHCPRTRRHRQSALGHVRPETSLCRATLRTGRKCPRHFPALSDLAARCRVVPPAPSSLIPISSARGCYPQCGKESSATASPQATARVIRLPPMVKNGVRGGAVGTLLLQSSFCTHRSFRPGPTRPEGAKWVPRLMARDCPEITRQSRQHPGPRTPWQHYHLPPIIRRPDAAGEGYAAQTHAKGHAHKGGSTDARPWRGNVSSMQVHDLATPIGRRYGVRTWGKSTVQGPGSRVQGRRKEGAAARRGREAATGACMTQGSRYKTGVGGVHRTGAAALALTRRCPPTRCTRESEGLIRGGACMSLFLLLKESGALLFSPAAPPHPDSISSSEYLLESRRRAFGILTRLSSICLTSSRTW